MFVLTSKFKLKHFPLFLFMVFLLFFAVDASAATLSFSPSSASVSVGNIVSVKVVVNTSGEAINNAEAIIQFPSGLLEVVSVSKSSSVFSLWVEEPIFSNSSGIVKFNGGVANPGFNGSNGSLISITFRAKASGTASLLFTDAAVRKNDGLGTNILTNMGNAQFSLRGAVPAPTVPEATTPSIVVSGVPSAPQISSPTHLDSNKWYAKKDAKFIWTVPSDVTSVRLLVDKFPRSIPTVVYTPVIDEREVTNLGDGIRYFHTQFRNAKGWGAVSHFRLQIDTQPPNPFSIEFVHGKEIIDPSPIINFNTTDATSGINYYRIKIGENNFFKVDPNLIISNPYALPPQTPGKNLVVVQAYDKAGNIATSTEEFEILALESPQITRYQKNITEGDLLEVGGKTYSDSDVDLFLFQEDKKVLEQKVKSNSSGDFTFIWSKKLDNGVYDIQAQVTDNRGARSLPSEKITIVVGKSTILQIGSWAVSLLAVLVPLIALIILFLFVVWYGWYKFSMFRKKLKGEVHKAESAIHKAFDLLKEDIREQVKMLEKAHTRRQLTEEEEKIIKLFKEDLEDTERFIKKEIESLEKEVE